MFKTRKGRVVISVAVSVFVLLYLIFQLHNVLSKNITTEFALSYEFDDKISADAYIIRDEEVVSAQTSGGVIGYCQQSGSKVQAESTVVLNLESTPKDIARRLVDFLSGVAYANHGTLKRVANSTFIITPYNVDIMGDMLIDELESNGLY